MQWRRLSRRRHKSTHACAYSRPRQDPISYLQIGRGTARSLARFAFELTLPARGAKRGPGPDGPGQSERLAAGANGIRAPISRATTHAPLPTAPQLIQINPHFLRLHHVHHSDRCRKDWSILVNLYSVSKGLCCTDRPSGGEDWTVYQGPRS